MSEQELAWLTLKILVGIGGVIGVVWKVVSVIRELLKEKASAKDVEELKTNVHKLRNSAVTADAMKERRLDVDRQIDEIRRDVENIDAQRRGGDTELHTRVDGLKDDMNKGFMETQRLILERLPKP